jgi:hypothetical protein
MRDTTSGKGSLGIVYPTGCVSVNAKRAYIAFADYGNKSRQASRLPYILFHIPGWLMLCFVIICYESNRRNLCKRLFAPSPTSLFRLALRQTIILHIAGLLSGLQYRSIFGHRSHFQSRLRIGKEEGTSRVSVDTQPDGRLHGYGVSPRSHTPPSPCVHRHPKTGHIMTFEISSMAVKKGKSRKPDDAGL